MRGAPDQVQPSSTILMNQDISKSSYAFPSDMRMLFGQRRVKAFGRFANHYETENDSIANFIRFVKGLASARHRAFDSLNSFQYILAEQPLFIAHSV